MEDIKDRWLAFWEDFISYVYIFWNLSVTMNVNKSHTKMIL